MAVKLLVRKRDGSTEEFKINKIVKACIKAGADERTAKKIAKEVKEELLIIPTSRIRDLVVERLRRANERWARNWELYELEKGKAP